MGNGSAAWKVVISWNVLHEKLSVVLLLDFCAVHGFPIINTMCEHKSVHKCTRHKDARGRKVNDRFHSCVILDV